MLLALGVLVVHDVGYLLAHPYWVDEAWVVSSTKVRWSELTGATGPTPIGFTLLLRAAVFGGEQRQRLIPLAAAGLSVGAAYLCGRELGLRRFTALCVLAVPVLLTPAMLLRNDLKQFTTEALLAVVVLLLTLRLESSWSRPRLAALAVVVGLGPLLANADLFFGSGALLAVAVVALSGRQWRRLGEVVVAGLAAGATMLAVVVLFLLPRQNPTLSHYWDAYYLPSNPADAATFLSARAAMWFPGTGLEFGWLALLLVLLGVTGLALRGYRASALLLPLAAIEVLVAGVADVYPVLDPRTSTWLSVLVVVMAGLGVALVAEQLIARGRAVPIGITLAATLAYVASAGPGVRSHQLPREDVRAQAMYVQTHRSPTDVVIVDLGANWGYAYYAEAGPLAVIPSGPAAATGFLIRYDDPRVVAMHSRDVTSPRRALAAARGLLPAGGRIFVVRSHVPRGEERGWEQALSGSRVTSVPVGVERLLIVQ